MNWIQKLQKRFPHLGIPNLTLYIVIGYVIGYFLQMTAPRLMDYLSLDMARILHGQVWRLVTWILYPPASSNVLFFAIAVLFFYYPIGTSLERTWGTFRYTLYILSGMLMMIAAALVVYLITGNVLRVGLYLYSVPGSIYTMYYITLSVFLAYALTYPNAQVLLWFVIPIRMSWMAIVYLVILLMDIVSYLRRGLWVMAVPIIVSLLNFALFTWTMRSGPRMTRQQKQRQAQFHRSMRSAAQAKGAEDGDAPRHRCTICGRTEKDNPELEFRYCSRCAGNYEYCQDHLFNHEHKR